MGDFAKGQNILKNLLKFDGKYDLKEKIDKLI